VTFDECAARCGSRLRAGLVAVYGPEVGTEAAADALAYGWENWPTVEPMDNPTGYLYRVGQSAARRYRRPQRYLPEVAAPGLPDFEPGLAPALEVLSEVQRVAVVMVHALGYPLTEVATTLGVSVSTLRTHLRRGMDKLRLALEVEPHVR